MDWKRLLIISNECLSDSSSNGRTIKNFLIGWPKDRVAQFFISSKFPDFDVCSNYFRMTDSQAIRNCFSFRTYGGVVSEEKNSSNNSFSNSKHIKKNSLSMMIRELIWSIGIWKLKGFNKWVKSLKPEIVLLQAGDSGFMFNLAVTIAKTYKSKLVIYNSENYYFKEYDYFRSTGLAHYLYPLFRFVFRKKFKKAIRFAELSIYNCKELEKEYSKEFSLPSATIYTSTEILGLDSKNNCKHIGSPFTVSYLGNMGVGRVDVLCEFAKTLGELDKESILQVYGKVPNEEMQQQLDSCSNIKCMGFVSYKKVVDVMKNSDLLIHVESFEEFYREDLKYAFSTKIADSLACGTPFLLYAPQTCVCSSYLKGNKLAFVVDNQKDLKELLLLIQKDLSFKNKYLSNALIAAKENHNLEKNRIKFQTLLLS